MLGDRFEVLDMSVLPGVEPPEETGTTFEENAAIKALHAAAHFDGLVLADDSGLEVDALGGAPGVYSARYVGAEATDAMNRDRLLAELVRVGVRGRDRSARFRCVLALTRGRELLATFEGTVEGVIVNREKGKGGFGYDPLFVPAGCCETMAELSAARKNSLSHRAEAARAFLRLYR